MKGLLLSASGSRAAYCVGAARVLIREAGLSYDLIAGIGMCGTVACILAQGEQSAQVADLTAVWGNTRGSDYGCFEPVEFDRGYFVGLSCWVPFFEKIRAGKVAESATSVLVGGWSHHGRGFYQWPGHSKELWEAVKMASGVIAHRPELEGRPGASPMQTLVMMGATKIDVVLDSPENGEPTRPGRADAFGVAFHHSASALSNFMNQDVDLFRSSANTRILRPSEWFRSMDDPLLSDPFSLRSSLEKGVKDAQGRFLCR